MQKRALDSKSSELPVFPNSVLPHHADNVEAYCAILALLIRKLVGRKLGGAVTQGTAVDEGFLSGGGSLSHERVDADHAKDYERRRAKQLQAGSSAEADLPRALHLPQRRAERLACHGRADGNDTVCSALI